MAEDHLYARLGVSEDATQEEIKRAYHKLILKYHPDKNVSESAIDQAHNVIEAWKILGDPEERRLYEEKLAILRAEISHAVFCETVPLEECTQVTENEYEFDCRCGGKYSILLTDVRIGLCVFPCSNCSLRLCIKTTQK